MSHSDDRIIEYLNQMKISQLPAGNKFIGISWFSKFRSLDALFEAFISAAFNVSKSLLDSFGDAADMVDDFQKRTRRSKIKSQRTIARIITTKEKKWIDGFSQQAMNSLETSITKRKKNRIGFFTENDQLVRVSKKNERIRGMKVGDSYGVLTDWVLHTFRRHLYQFWRRVH